MIVPGARGDARRFRGQPRVGLARRHEPDGRRDLAAGEAEVCRLVGHDASPLAGRLHLADPTLRLVGERGGFGPAT
jgi:hypothetical protein